MSISNNFVNQEKYYIRIWDNNIEIYRNKGTQKKQNELDESNVYDCQLLGKYSWTTQVQ